jgi:hypothetical protein
MNEPDHQLMKLANVSGQTLVWAQRVINDGIESDDDYELAGEIVRRAKQEKAEAEKEYKELYQPAKLVVDRLRNRWREVSAPWDLADRILRQAMTLYTEQKEQAAREEALLLAAKAREELDKPDADAEKVEAMIEKAQRIDESPPPVSGVSYRESWTVEVDDITALCGAVAVGEAASDLVQPNMKRLREMAKAMKDTFNVPGCRAVAKKVMQVRK